MTTPTEGVKMDQKESERFSRLHKITTSDLAAWEKLSEVRDLRAEFADTTDVNEMMTLPRYSTHYVEEAKLHAQIKAIEEVIWYFETTSPINKDSMEYKACLATLEGLRDRYKRELGQ